MARKLTKEELEKCKADFDIPQGLKPKYKVAEQAKVSRSTLKKGKAARAACDSPKVITVYPEGEKHAGRPRTNPEGSKVWALRVTDEEKIMIKHVLDYTRKINGFIYEIRDIDDDDKEKKLRFAPSMRKYMFGTSEPVVDDV